MSDTNIHDAAMHRTTAHPNPTHHCAVFMTRVVAVVALLLGLGLAGIAFVSRRKLAH